MRKIKRMLCILLSFSLILSSLSMTTVSAESASDTIITVPITVQEEYGLAEDFYELLNKNRKAAGKYEYIMDDRLMDLAMERAAQCCIYFTHLSLTYNREKHGALSGTYIDKYGDYPITTFMQEDIAEGLADAQSTYTVWYRSDGHRPLLTDTSNYKYCGIGVVTYHGKREWVLVVSNAPVGNIVEKVSGSKTNTRNIRAKVKYFSRKNVGALDEWVNDPFAFSDIESGVDGYQIQQPGIFTFQNNSPELIDIDSMGRLKPKANGKGSFTVYYKNIEVCTVNVTAYHDEEETEEPTPTPTPVPAEPPKETPTPIPTEAPEVTESPEPSGPPEETESPDPSVTPGETVSPDPIEIPKETEIPSPDDNITDEAGGETETEAQKFKVKVKNVTYNGKRQKPGVVVYSGNKKLSPKNYKVYYKDNKNVGYGTVVVKGTGEYKKCSVTGKFKIALKKVSISSVKSKGKRLYISWNRTGGNQGYQIQYSLSKNFHKKVKTIKVSSKKKHVTVWKASLYKKYYVRIRSYKKIGNKIWYSKWSKAKRSK